MPEIAVNPLHQPVAAAVHVLPADDVVAGLEQLQHGVERGEARAEGKSVGGAFQAGHVSLQRLTGGVLGPGVLVAPVLADTLLDVGGGLVDRGHHGPGQGLGDLAGMDRAGGEAVVVVVWKDPGHASYSEWMVKRNSGGPKGTYSTRLTGSRLAPLSFAP